MNRRGFLKNLFAAAIAAPTVPAAIVAACSPASAPAVHFGTIILRPRTLPMMIAYCNALFEVQQIVSEQVGEMVMHTLECQLVSEKPEFLS